MAGLKLIARSRPVFNPGDEIITFALPVDAAGAQVARKGDLLVLLLLSDATETGFTEPAGWTVVDTIGDTEAQLAVRARLVDDDEPLEAVLELAAATKERQGQLLVLRPGVPALVRESSVSATFAATMAPAAPEANAKQAINLALAVWSSSGSPALTAPAGYTQLDSYATALATSRSCLFAIATAGVTGAFTPPAAAADVNATGRAFVEVLRDRQPFRPEVLEDPVPGNIGLVPR